MSPLVRALPDKRTQPATHDAGNSLARCQIEIQKSSRERTQQIHSQVMLAPRSHLTLRA